MAAAKRAVENVIREPIQPEDIAPMKVLQRIDGVFFVFDPSLPIGKRTACTQPNYDAAVIAARARKKDANADNV
jgi:hypothetical protein